MRIVPVILILVVLIIISCDNTKQDFHAHYFGQTPPTDTVELFAPDYLSPKENYRDAAFTPDGKEFYFTRIKNDSFTIMVCKYENNQWNSPQVAPFSGSYNDFEPCITHDGNYFYFASMRPSKLKPKMKNDIDIWKMKRNNKGWDEPRLLDTTINTPCMEYFPSIAANGNLYFGRNDKKMIRGDIYFSKPINGKFTKPEKLPEIINLPSTSFNAFISPDEIYLIFSTYVQKDEHWHSDMYISFRNAENQWTEPMNMGSKINSNGNDHAPSLSPDGKHLFFASTRRKTSKKNKEHNIFWIDTDIINMFKSKQ